MMEFTYSDNFHYGRHDKVILTPNRCSMLLTKINNRLLTQATVPNITSMLHSHLIKV